jgi:alkanesulfonate monooxygenase SsuD/methylene tetrahydromethanopterin reductase-like flavin-dependent oxidoreductase (luciferase family)
MQIGVVLNIVGEPGRPDGNLVMQHLALGNLVEPLGFDSLFVLEHHFTDYILSPAPFQILAFYAGRTSRIILGTAVVVLPWNDPVRVAEQISMLDIMCHGRCLFAFGRGKSAAEFAGFRVPIDESRDRFCESLEIVRGLLSTDLFHYSGKFFRIPPLTVRPRAISKPQQRFYIPVASPEAATQAAEMGCGVLLATEKQWTELATMVDAYRNIHSVAQCEVRKPIVIASVYVAQTRVEAEMRALTYFERDWKMMDMHYQFSDGHLSQTSSYEKYKGTEEFFKELRHPSFRDHAVRDYTALQIIGTPGDCVEKIHRLFALTTFEHLALEFSYGAMPIAEAEANLRLFASEVLPQLRQAEPLSSKRTSEGAGDGR